MHPLSYYVKHLWLYIRGLGKWLVLALITGVLCGLVGSFFHEGVQLATELRTAHPWLLWLLPAAGLAIVWVYRQTRTLGQGTNNILDEVHEGNGVSPWLLPAIFLGTVLTHLCGGSAGREGAALQMGGAIGYNVSRLLRLDDRDKRTATMVGMAAFFSALFGTPMTASIFAIMVISVGVFYHPALVPCLIASLTSFGVSVLMGVEPTAFTVAAPALNPVMLIRVAVLAAMCAFVAVLFCAVVHHTEHLLSFWLPNPWTRAAAGGAVIVLLSLLPHGTDYNGAGMNIITAAVEQGSARPEAFFLKLLFTAITLGAGFKGGEVVPSFFVGATFGAVWGPLLGIPGPFAGSIGLVAVFCGVTNCPVASTFLAIELFGAGGLQYYALACCLSYVLSGYSGLYSSQTIVYSKLKARYINVHTNAHHMGENGELE